MFATEIDDSSITIANQNIDKNQLTDKIQIIKSNMNVNDPYHILINNKIITSIDFTMCNPPFFNDIDTNEMGKFKNRTGKRKLSKHAKSGNINELCTTGGEIAYIKRMIESSKLLKNHIKIFTTMIGHKINFLQLQKELKNNQIYNYSINEFCQGKTTRWGIVWTFHDNFILRNVPFCTSSIENNKNNIKWCINDEKFTIEDIRYQLWTILDELTNVELKEICKNDEKIEFNFIAYENSWSNQRRKKRAKILLQTKLDDDDDSEQSIKRIKLNENEILEAKKSLYLKLMFCISKKLNNIQLDVKYLLGNGYIDATHQLVQYIRNKCTIIH